MNTRAMVRILRKAEELLRQVEIEMINRLEIDAQYHIDIDRARDICIDLASHLIDLEQAKAEKE